MCLQVYLQEIAWTEDQKPAAVARRAEHAQHAEERALLAEEPMFCYQTSVALHHWSCLTYMGACLFLAQQHDSLHLLASLGCLGRLCGPSGLGFTDPLVYTLYPVPCTLIPFSDHGRGCTP